MSSDRDISVLNDLIKTTLDNVKAFQDASEDAHETRFEHSFSEFARERSRVASLLQEEVRRLGGDPEDSTSFLSAAHRGFMDLKQALTGKDDKAILEEVQRGEDHIRAKFESALQDKELSGEARAAIERTYLSVRAGHDAPSPPQVHDPDRWEN